MSISARCECGHRMAVADVMAGKSIKCSKCGGPITVPSASALPKNPPGYRGVKTPRFSISPAILGMIAACSVILTFLLVMYFGPWTVAQKWSEMSGTANTQVTDVVDFAIRAYESQHGLYDASQSHHVPQVDGPASFVAPYMAFSMPTKIPFVGKTNQGNYIGDYNTTTGEVSADIETGGYTVGGLVDVKKATGKFHMTGSEKDGNVEAEADGVPLKIVILRPLGKDE